MTDERGHREAIAEKLGAGADSVAVLPNALQERQDGSPPATRQTPKPGYAMRGPSKRMVFAAVFLLALVIGGLALTVTENGLMVCGRILAERIDTMGAWGCAAVIGLMVIHSFVPFPAEFLAIAAGGIYGTVVGTALIWVGAMLGAALSFALARRLGRPFAEAVLSERQRDALDGWTDDKGAMALLSSRFVPVIAFNLINYAAGLTKVSWWTFLWTTGLGILPLTALMVGMGSHMRELSWPVLIASSVVGIAGVVALHYWVKRRQRFSR